MPAPSLRLAFVALLALVSLACAPYIEPDWSSEDPDSFALYTRPRPPKPRIPGAASTSYRYATQQTPMKLTASDGSGLVLRSLQVEGLLIEPASLTQLHMSFENPHDRTLDGRFELLLPRGAEISRFAMKVGGQWVESEIVERLQARQVYGDHKHQRRDPALLERERGRRFSGRIFPIAPRERKEIILSYTNLHGESDPRYRLPLAGLPRVDELDVQIVHRRPGQADELVELHSEHEAPTRDLELALDGPASLGMASGKQALMRVVPVSPLAPDQAAAARPKGISILVDTSASMAPLARAGDEALGQLLDALLERELGQVPIEILAFDQVVEPIYRGPLSGALEPTMAALGQRARLGASDLARAIEAIDPSSERLILLGDGDISAGISERYGLSQVLERAAEQGLQRVDALALDEAINLEQLEWLVAPEHLRAGAVIDTARSAPKVWAAQLLSPPSPPVRVAVKGASSVWPERFSGLHPGQAVMVHAQFGRKAPSTAQLEIELGEQGELRRENVELRRGEDPLVDRSIAVLRSKALMAEISELSSGARQTERWRELVELSKQHRLLNDYTSLLVLESERDYERFGIERGEVETLVITRDPVAANGELVVESMAIGMDQARALPVGASSSRDFTTVVDLEPTASRDSAGISLAGTTSAYIADGHEAEAYRRKRRRNWKVEPKRTELGPRRAQLPAASESTLESFDGVMRQCAQHQLAVDLANDFMPPIRIELDYLLQFDADGRLVGVQQHYAGPRSFDDCAALLTQVLGGPDWDERPAHATPTHELFVNYAIELPLAAGSPPADWRIPAVIAYGAERLNASGDGAGGWAQFIAEDLEAGLVSEALDVAWTWHLERPNSPLPYVSLGHALLAAGKQEEAARAYASLIDLQPTQAEPRRFAAALLESLDHPGALSLAIDSYRKARAIRPDQPLSYHALALALARSGELQAAVNTLVDALGRSYTAGRFGASLELMREDLATLAAAAILAEPELRAPVLAQLVDTMVVPNAEARDCIRLSWESDASHIALRLADIAGQRYDAGSSESVSEEVANGYGTQGFEWQPELEGPVFAGLEAVELGPEGAAMGSVRRMSFDGESLRFETRPFVLRPGQRRIALGRFEPADSPAWLAEQAN